MVKVRLYRTGARGKPSYRIVVMDQRKKRQGRVLELLGTYDPRGTGGIQYSETRPREVGRAGRADLRHGAHADSPPQARGAAAPSA